VRKKKGRKTKKPMTKKQALMLGAGILAAGGGIYLVVNEMKKRREQYNAVSPMSSEEVFMPVNVSTPGINPGKTSLPGRNIPSPVISDNFPLRSGSQGERVRKLQSALETILGTTAFKKFTAIDGKFGKGTIAALKAAKLSTVIDEPTFNKLTQHSPTISSSGLNVNTVAASLYRFASGKNFDSVMQQLRQLNSVEDYQAVNKRFIALQVFSVSKSIVTYLLDAFSSNSTAKEQIKDEFRRIGLQQKDDGKWSLAGIHTYKDIKTIHTTYVSDTNNFKIPVQANTILGSEISIQNGMTKFKSVDGNIYTVPTQSITYVK
jgi:peptidoglycan hydrolase-like protein with peptidoglycan-binding domain